ncbi:MAG: FkbM family methyltransferase [Sulfuricurvum sp.]|uniref:FkbM family methyltransferase n=1 Tax=Sulfuricurvum sp. TaxID=2025608 RepID=UPI0026353F5B|nr:FkbM family methyltransferase [Sulfuricurvum sp.]MDD5159205.1 FkbM family methyltransferase [Sulfuricurvum sp.]
MDKVGRQMMLVVGKETIDLKKEKLATRFFSDEKVKRYVLGRNKNTQNLLSAIAIDGFIDDFTDMTEWLGKPVFKSSDILNKNDVIVVSCSLAIYPHTAIKNLQHAGFKYILDYLELVKYSNINLSIEFIDEAKQDIELNWNKYNYIFSKIKETKSRKIYSDLINFRQNRNLSYLVDYKVDQIGQYFEDFLNFTDNEVFVDAGGYDGQTSIEFIKRCPTYKSIYIFEPSKENLTLAKKNLKDFKNVNFISKGLSNQKETLRFDTGSGSASSISENGTIEIEVDTLDTLVTENVTFIKMDIEGAESLAIDGMKNHILNDYPKMAISVYHKVDDLWKIPEQILAIRNDYDLFIRHYTEGTDETVMFFIPKQMHG